jgi:hypothetical protein
MHSHLKAQGLDADAIREQIRKPMFAAKVKKWPSELAEGRSRRLTRHWQRSSAIRSFAMK